MWELPQPDFVGVALVACVGTGIRFAASVREGRVRPFLRAEGKSFGEAGTVSGEQVLRALPSARSPHLFLVSRLLQWPSNVPHMTYKRRDVHEMLEPYVDGWEQAPEEAEPRVEPLAELMLGEPPGLRKTELHPLIQRFQPQPDKLFEPPVAQDRVGVSSSSSGKRKKKGRGGGRG